MRHRIKEAVWIFGVCLGALASVNVAMAQFIEIEYIDPYPFCDPLWNNEANAQGFRSPLLNTATGVPYFSTGTEWDHENVFGTDFLEADGFGGQDTFNFDRPESSFSYFSGHGILNRAFSSVACTSTAACPARAGRTAACLRADTTNTGRCAYSEPRAMVMNDCTNIFYGSQRWGESANSGGWRGAGTNGGTNFVVADISFGVTPNLWMQQTVNSFAGVRVFSTIMPTNPVSGDTVDTASRGYSFGWSGTYLADGAAGAHWLEAMDFVTGGDPCVFGGGAHGVSGCGAHISLSVDVNQTEADQNIWTRDWESYFGNANDATGAGWMSWGFQCNYDCNTWDWSMP